MPPHRVTCHTHIAAWAAAAQTKASQLKTCSSTLGTGASLKSPSIFAGALMHIEAAQTVKIAVSEVHLAVVVGLPRDL